MKRRRIKKQVYVIGIPLILLIVFAIFGIRYLVYRGTNEYKLKKLGYQTDEIAIIEKLESKQIAQIMNMEYDNSIVKFMKEKYFIFENLDRYLSYQKKEKDNNFTHIVSMVNVGADHEYYDEDFVEKTNTNLKDEYLILVNKFHYLDQDFAPDDIVEIRNWYAYGENEIRQQVYDQFLAMYKAAEKEDLKLIITSSYRDYAYQDSLWKRYSRENGKEWADSVSARPGYSEHQTGLSLDIVTDGEGSSMSMFETTDEFKWLSKNAHKYGFILRYPKGKEDITGYAYESWHYRYVGVEVATKIHELGITYDEYYAYYKDEIEA